MYPKSKWASLRLRFRNWVRGWRFDWSYLYWRLGLLAVGLPLIFIYIIGKELARSVGFDRQQAHGFRCADYASTISSVIEEGNAMQKRYAALGGNAALRCTFGHEENLPYVNRTLAALTEFTNCPTIGPEVRELVAKLKEHLAPLEVEVAQSCAKASK
jgi:hypothetical protein